MVKGKRPRGQDFEALVEKLRQKARPLVICLSNAWGGLEQVAVDDTLDLGRVGIKTRILCTKGSPIHDHLLNKDVEVVPIEHRPRDFLDFKFRNILMKEIERGSNLIHTHQPSLLGSISPWIWSNHDVALFASRHIMSNHNKRTFIHQLIYSRLDALIVMSETLKENVLKTHPLRERQVKVIRLGIDFDRFDPAKVDTADQRRHWGANDETIVIGMVGRIDPAKGQEVFIKAAAGLTKYQFKAPIRFVIVGGETPGIDTDYFDGLKRTIKQLGIEDLFVFSGYQKDIPTVMASFDIFVMPSRQETFGLVAIEAMAMGCPIVISKGGSAVEIVGQRDFGLLMRPEDPYDLQSQLKTLIEKPLMRKEMGQRAREHVGQTYDRKFRIEGTVGLYEWVLRRRGI